MKEVWKKFAQKVTAFLDRLGEDYNMDFVNDWYGFGTSDVYDGLPEDGLFA